jgi:hypothetical protein
MMKKKSSILIIMLILWAPLCFSPFTVDANPIIGSSSATLEAIADAYVNASSPATNYGDVSSMYVSANAELDYIYVMFDLSSIPPGAHIISATLRMYLSSTGGDIYGLPADRIGAYYCSDNSWTELGITWNNKPTFSSGPTATWSFSLIYTYKVYKSWDVTADAKTAFSSGKLTEVLKFSAKTSNGYAIFGSREGVMPQLEVEYSTEPVCMVHLESNQDTAATNSLGITTIADYPFSLPSDVEVIAGDYQVMYSGGYTFMRWETSGGVSVSDAYSSATTVTVSDNGTLRAVGNVNQLEYSYDCGDYASYDSCDAGCIDAVRFSPLVSGQLLMARLYMENVYSFYSNNFYVHVMDENRDDIIAPFEQTPTSEGWFNVDLSSYGINVNVGTDFYIGMEWINDDTPDLGHDNAETSGRNWNWNGTMWDEIDDNFMIRAVVGTATADYATVDHTINVDGADFHVTTKSNSEFSDCQLNIEYRKLVLTVAETSGIYGFCDVTIPNQMLGGPYDVIPDESLVIDDFSFDDNGTHTVLHFIYPQSTSSIEITGYSVVPESLSAIVMLIFMFLVFIVFALTKKK